MYKLKSLSITALALAAVGCAEHDSPELSLSDESPGTVTVKVMTGSTAVTGGDVLKVVSNSPNSKIDSRAQGAPTVTPVCGSSGDTLFYAVNYPENGGFTIVSANRDLTPVLAYSETGSFIPNNGAVSAWIDEVSTIDTDAIPDSIKNANRSQWASLTADEMPLFQLSRSSISPERQAAVEECIAEWESRGYSVYSLYSDLSQFPTGLRVRAEQLISSVDMANTTVYETTFILEQPLEEEIKCSPLLKTKWNQGYPYNLGIGGKRQLGCVTLAIASIIHYHGKSSPGFNFASMPSVLPYSATSTAPLPQFLADVYNNVIEGIKIVDDKTILSGSSIEKADSCFTHYGYSGNLTNYNALSVENSISSYGPVYIRASVTGKNEGHAWVTDGYRKGNHGTKYTLVEVHGDFPGFGADANTLILASEAGAVYPYNYLHMCWGLGGQNDGFYHSTDSWYVPAIGTLVDEKQVIMDIKYKY